MRRARFAADAPPRLHALSKMPTAALIRADSGTDGFQMSRVALGTRFRFGVFASLWVANPARGGYGLRPEDNLAIVERTQGRASRPYQSRSTVARIKAAR